VGDEVPNVGRGLAQEAHAEGLELGGGQHREARPEVGHELGVPSAQRRFRGIQPESGPTQDGTGAGRQSLGCRKAVREALHADGIDLLDAHGPVR
jgi:hypothetical protein